MFYLLINLTDDPMSPAEKMIFQILTYFSDESLLN